MTSKRHGWMFVTVLIASIALVLSACGGGDDDDGGEDNETPAATEAPSDDGDEGEDDGETGEDDGGGAGSEEIDALLQRFGDSTFRADYEVTGITSADLGFEDPVFTMYKDGRERLRFDISGIIEGEEVAIIFIENAEAGGFCVRGDIGLPIEGGADGACFTDSQLGEQLGSISDNFDELENTDFDVLDESERQIAGQDAQCYRLKDLSDQTESDVCVNDDGALLYLSDEDGTVFEATDFSAEVSDSDFDLPYEVQEIPGL